jgi:diaminopimelate epimerase
VPEIPFRKFQGTGNDFVIFDVGSTTGFDRADLAIEVCHRHRGIGADGAIWVDVSDGQLAMEMRNPDGSIAEMCGNGLRCFAIAARDAGYWSRPTERVRTGAGILEATIDGEFVSVQMGRAALIHESVPTSFGPARGISIGNPHLVIPIEHLIAPSEHGPELEHHPLFPDRTNVHWRIRQGDHGFLMLTWERGAGETLACGTGACAVAFSAILDGLAEIGQPLSIRVGGGELQVTVHADHSVTMRGPAVAVFDGVWPA